MNLQRRAGVEGKMAAADGDRSSWWWFLDTRVATGAWQQVGRPRWWNAAPQRAKNCQWARLQLTTNGAGRQMAAGGDTTRAVGGAASRRMVLLRRGPTVRLGQVAARAG